MKIVIARLIKCERGQAMILALILLIVGALITVPLLGFLSTGLISGQVHEKKLAELYAADAGIEDAMWYLMNMFPIWEQAEIEEFMDETHYLTVNSKDVEFVLDTVSYGEWGAGEVAYQIDSTATSEDGSQTLVRAYCMSPDWSAFLDNVITSGANVTLQPGVDYEGIIVENYSQEYWPMIWWLSAFYLGQITDPTPYPDAEIDVATDSVIGPFYREGDLDIQNEGAMGTDAWIDGVIYVNGNLDIGTEKHDFTLHMDCGDAIFATGSINIGGKCTITGSGVIVSVGDLDFAPQVIVSGENDYIFVMSITGFVFAHPQGDFFGSFAGNVEVQMQPQGSINWNEPPSCLNFPTGNLEWLQIHVYEINPAS